MRLFRTWVFKWWEVSLLKIGIGSFGIILGLIFPEYLLNLIWLWVSLFIFILVYFLIKLLE